MLSILFLISVLWTGFAVSKKIGASFVVGSLISLSFLYILLLLTHNLGTSLSIYSLTVVICVLFTYKPVFTEIKNHYHLMQFVPFVVLVSLSFVLFGRTFSYADNSFLIASNLYQDFGSHIAVIRYFSSGGYLPEVPYFAGGGLLYHFMFDFYAGVLEYLGARVDVALNLISALTFTSFILLLYEFSYKLFKNRLVAIVSCLLFVLATDLSFIEVVRKYGMSIASYYHHNSYTEGNLLGLAMGKNFLNINTYLNQRHLIFGLGVFIFVLISLYFSKKLSNLTIVLLALLVGFLPFWNFNVLISLYIILAVSVFLFKEFRANIIKVILISLFLTVPQLLLVKQNSINQILLNPGFTIASNFSAMNFLLFWSWNLGFAIPAVVLGYLTANNFQRKVFASFLVLFVLANIFQFSRDMFDNHKFFNVWFVSISSFAAFGANQILSKPFGKVIYVILLFTLTISGVAHLLVVKNDVMAKVGDSSKTEFGNWIKSNTSTDDIFLSNGDIYDPASLTGKRTFLGRSHYVYLFGGDPNGRIAYRQELLDGRASTDLSGEYGVDYIAIYKSDYAPNSLSTKFQSSKLKIKIVYQDENAVVYKK